MCDYIKQFYKKNFKEKTTKCPPEKSGIYISNIQQITKLWLLVIKSNYKV